jgi:hypothetical protein
MGGAAALVNGSEHLAGSAKAEDHFTAVLTKLRHLYTAGREQHDLLHGVAFKEDRLPACEIPLVSRGDDAGAIGSGKASEQGKLLHERNPLAQSVSVFKPVSYRPQCCCL